MAYLDQQAVEFQPQWWSAAIYKDTPGYGYKFQGWAPARFVKRSSQNAYEMQNYSSYNGYAIYPMYWDPNVSRWMRYAAGIGPRVAGSDVRQSEKLVGQLERRNPLPPGRYWTDVFDKQLAAWNAWAIANVKSGKIKIVKAENFTADPLRSGEWLPSFLRPDNAGTIPARLWVLFDVLEPATWNAQQMGFYPTIATPNVKTSADTAQNPPGPSPLEEIEDAAASAIKPLAWAAGAYLALSLLLKLRK